MKVKDKKGFIINITLSCVTLLFVAIMTVSNILAFVVYPNVLQSFFGMTGASVENYDTNQYFAREAPSYQAALDRTAILGRMIEAEGAVLLKNDNNSLPLESGAKVSCFSQSSVDFIYGVTAGSGASSTAARATLQEVLENEGIRVNPTLWNFYKDKNYHRGATRITGGTPKFHYIMMGIDIGLSIIIVSCLGVIALNTLVFSPKRRKKLLDKGDIYEK